MRIVSLLALKLVLLTRAEQGIDSEINVDSCTSKQQYFDSMQFVCTDCPENMKADEAGLNCICDDGFVLKNDICTQCDAGQAPNQEGTECMSCDGSMDSSIAG
jgi:hypothetical protein